MLCKKENRGTAAGGNSFAIVKTKKKLEERTEEEETEKEETEKKETEKEELRSRNLGGN